MDYVGFIRTFGARIYHVHIKDAITTLDGRSGILASHLNFGDARRGWDFLVEVTVQPDGRVGYVQPIGDRAIPGQVVDQNSTAHFGVGAFLLAAVEMARLLERP